MFAILVVEREPIKLESLPANLFMWTLTAGAVAGLVGLLVWNSCTTSGARAAGAHSLRGGREVHAQEHACERELPRPRRDRRRER